MGYSFKVLFLTVLVLLPLVAVGSEGDSVELDTIANEFWEWRAQDVPEFSTLIGDSRYNDRLEDMRWEMFEVRKNKSQQFLDKVNDIDRSKLKSASQINYDILKDNLVTFIDGYQWSFYGALNPLNFLEGVYTDPGSVVDPIPFNTWGDFVNYLSRLNKMPLQMTQMVDRQRKAIALGHTYNNVSVKAIVEEVDAFSAANPVNSAFYGPFNNTLGELKTISNTDKAKLRQQAVASVGNLLAAYVKMKTFISDEYMPHTRKSFGVENWEMNGKKNYDACLKWHLSLDMTPEEVHQKGLDEVKRISKTMKEIMKRLGKTGTIKEFFDEVANDTRFHRNTADELLEIYQELTKNATEKLPQMFNNYPGLPVRVQEMASNGPMGMYSQGSEDGSRPGTFFANILRPKEVPLIDMPALTFHETVPGHHLQNGYAATAGLPKFRKYIDFEKYYAVPFNFPFYTAYVEGWALYAESLGEELGLYQTDYELMGRYGSEIFRACRLVVDTGLHHFSWDREQAIDYILNYTAYTRHNAETEVDRYLTWPGQACAYKIGELKIKELRQKATDQLGTLFNIKDFHGVILNNGPMPLTVMENLVNSWIAETKAKEKDDNSTDCASSHRGVEILIYITIVKLVHMYFV